MPSGSTPHSIQSFARAYSTAKSAGCVYRVWPSSLAAASRPSSGQNRSSRRSRPTCGTSSSQQRSSSARKTGWLAWMPPRHVRVLRSLPREHEGRGAPPGCPGPASPARASRVAGPRLRSGCSRPGPRGGARTAGGRPEASMRRRRGRRRGRSRGAGASSPAAVPRAPLGQRGEHQHLPRRRRARRLDPAAPAPGSRGRSFLRCRTS